MEAGIEPAEPSHHDSPAYSTAVTLSEICTNLLYNLKNTNTSKTEQNIILKLLQSTNSHMLLNINITKHNRYTSYPTDYILKLTQYQENLWKNLTHTLYSTKVRHNIFLFLTYLDQFQTLIIKNTETTPFFSQPKKTSSPSVFVQVVKEPTTIIDPYESSLAKNYYFVLSSSLPSEEMEDITNAQTPASSPSAKLGAKKTTVTAEDSIETITDLLAEMEEDELPVQTQTEAEEFQPATQVQPTYFNHRFAIYRKSSTPYVSNAPSQLNLFKSFCKNLKSIDPQVQILPMRNDRQIHPLSTTDQINNVDEIGIPNFFKPYKRTKKTLSGDFHIGTKLTFEELKTNTNFTTWFHMNGYNVMLNSCQTSDMVRIGFLNRVRTFTYRDDLKTHIMQSGQWKENQFHFRLYFDSFSTNAKGSLTYVLMIDVDRPSIDAGMKFFQTFFNGDQQNSPNKLSYLFFPLFRKNYSDDERKTIIQDNDHHTEGVSVVALAGLQDLNGVVELNQGIKISIRHLLLAVPAQGTSTGKLFVQVERQPTNHWLLCCFHTVDATKVTLRLGVLEALLKRYVKTEDYGKLFSSDDWTLKFNGHAAPIKKGKNQRLVQEVPESTMQYAMSALKKLHTPAPKRLAVEFEPQSTGTSESTTPASVTPVTRPPSTMVPPISLTGGNRIESVESTLLNQNTRLLNLEECCAKLATSTKNLENQLVSMNENIFTKMQEMANAINSLNSSPKRRNPKVLKPSENLTMDIEN
jgi:hypothetical protein